MSARACPYCGAEARLVKNSRRLYGRDLGPVWMCIPCPKASSGRAYVKANRQGEPGGTLADDKLTHLRRRVRRELSPLVYARIERGAESRVAWAKGTRWLGSQIGRDPESFRLSSMDTDQCALALRALTHAQQRLGLKADPELDL